MKLTGKRIMLSGATILALSGGAVVVNNHLTQVKKPAAYVAKQDTVPAVNNLSFGNSSDALSPTAVSQPTQPIVNGQVSQAFINRFNNAIVLQNNGQFVIEKDLLPENTTTIEMTALNQLISQANSQMQQAVKDVPKANIIKSGNSAVIGQTAAVAQQQAQGNKMDLTSRTRYHNGGNYCHVYWWGLRIGISRNTLHAISRNSNYASLLGFLSLVPYGPVKAASVVLGSVLPALGTAASRAPGGIVFNATPTVLPVPSLNVWGEGWQ